MENFLLSLSNYILKLKQNEKSDKFNSSFFDRLIKEQHKVLLINSQNFEKISYQYMRFIFIKKESLLYTLKNYFENKRNLESKFFEIFKLNLPKKNISILEVFSKYNFNKEIKVLNLTAIKNIENKNLHNFNENKKQILENFSEFPLKLEFLFNLSDIGIFGTDSNFMVENNINV